MRVISAGLLIALAGACNACKKKDDDKQGAGAADTAKATPALQQALAYMPLQADAVIGLDLAKLRASSLYQHYQKDVEGQVAGELQQIRDLCGFDPLPKLQTVVAGGTGSRRSGEAVAVVTGLGKAEVLGCLSKVAASPPPQVKVTIDGDFAMIETYQEPLDPTPPAAAPAGDAGAAAAAPAPTAELDDAISVQFTGDTTAVLARRGGNAIDKASMQQLLAAKPGAAGSISASPGFMEMIDGIDTEAPIWFVVNGKSDRIRQVGQGFLTFDAAFGHVAVKDDLFLDLTLRLDTPDSAKRFAELAKRQIDSFGKSLLKDKVGPVTVEQKDKDVRFTVRESREQLEKLIDFAADLPMLLGN